MLPVDKFILHITHNLFQLNEYSEGEIKRLMNKFKEEADDLNISITDSQLKKYIERFDALKNSPKITEKDLRKYSLSKLIKLVTASKGADEEDEEDDTPDIVYNENGLIIYNGSKEDNCLSYGNGEKWCITRGSFSNYRYDSNRKNPTFYLVKDTNLPDSNPKSFFVVVVGSDNTYKVSNRTNNDVGGTQTEWERWENWNFVERNFPSVTNLRHIFKYIPLSSKEKLAHNNSEMTFREWLKQPFNFKEQYLVIKKGKKFFSDISNEEFITKFIPKLPSIANILSHNNDIAGTPLLIKTIDSFSKQDQNSIIANIRQSINLNYLRSESIPFEVKKALVKANKWDLQGKFRIYITKDGFSIVLLHLGEDLTVGVYTEDDDYPSIKINDRTSKYILDYPELDTIPIKYLMQLLEKGAIDKENIDKILKKTKEDSNSSIIVKDINNKEIIIDTNSFSAYTIEDNKLEKADINDEDVKKAFNSIENKQSFINGIKELFSPLPNTTAYKNLPEIIDKKFLHDIINSLPYENRILRNDGGVILSSLTDSNPSFFIMVSNLNNNNVLKASFIWENRTSYRYYTLEPLNEDQQKEYWKFLRGTNQTLSDNAIINSLRDYWVKLNEKKLFFKTNPPLNPNNNLIPKFSMESYYLVNKINPSQSYKLSGTNKLVKTNIPIRKAIEMGIPISSSGTSRGRPRIGVAQQITQLPIRRGRGRPPRSTQTAVVTNQQNEEGIDVDDLFTEQGLIRGFENLPSRTKRSLSSFRGISRRVNQSRGASRRQNMLGANGTVQFVIEFGNSSVYIIRLSNGTKIASINKQPGNQHFIVTSFDSFHINSPAELVTALRNRNLLEIRHFITREYLERNPNHLNEIRELIKQHMQETKTT